MFHLFGILVVFEHWEETDALQTVTAEAVQITIRQTRLLGYAESILALSPCEGTPAKNMHPEKV